MGDTKSSQDELDKLWILYSSQPSPERLVSYLDRFILMYKATVDTEQRNIVSPPNLTDMENPEILDMLSNELNSYSCHPSPVELAHLNHVEKLLNTVIILSRNTENIPLVASCDFVQVAVRIASTVLSTLSYENVENVSELTSFVKLVLSFFECLYDPHNVWRKTLNGWRMDPSQLSGSPSFLHEEVIPFFYECCQEQSAVDVEVQTQLFHVFGAIISGAKGNALKAICPATVDIMFKVLRTGSHHPHQQHHYHSQQQQQQPVAIREELLQLKYLVLKCLVRVVHCVHTCRAEERQVEVGMVLEDFFQVLLHMDHGTQTKTLQVKFLQSMNEMLHCENKEALQVVFLAEGAFETLVAFLHKMTLTGIEAQTLAMSIISVMKAIMTGSRAAKDTFRKKIGYSHFVEGLKKLGQPSTQLLENIFDMIVEGSYKSGATLPIANAQAVLMLIQWLPDISSTQLQIWLADCMRKLCCHGNHNRMECCNEGIISAILDVLTLHEHLEPQSAEHLIHLLEALGTLSITAIELTQFLQLLKADVQGTQHPYSAKLMHALGVMARKDGKEGALHYFNQPMESDGILVGSRGKCCSSAMSFTAWLCLDQRPEMSEKHQRRQIYSFVTPSGNGFEAFFTPSGVLTVAVLIKKEYHTVALTEYPITDNQWHCISVSHSPAKRPFQSSQITVYIDHHKRLTTHLKFPTVNEGFEELKIGSPGSKPVMDIHPLNSITPEAPAKVEAKTSRFSVPGMNFLKNALPSAVTGGSTSSSSSSSSSSNPTPQVSTLKMELRDRQFGPAVGILGQLSSVALFSDALSEDQMRSINAAGPNCFGLFQMPGLSELQSKLVFQYNAKASLDNMCKDLSANELHGELYGKKCTTSDIKDVINSLGGILVLFPLLEQIKGQCNSPCVVWNDRIAPPVPASPEKDWVVVPSSSYADDKLEKNPVAGFLTVLRHMIFSSTVNQETLVRENAMAMKASLLHRCESSQIDVNVLMAIQLLVDTVNKDLLNHVYQYLLFDFRIWCNTEFPIRIGHIQYLSTLIKDNKTFFRKKYGVQYMLDIIRQYYSSSVDHSAVDARTIRGSLFSLIKYYMSNDASYDELNALLAFLYDGQHEPVVSEGLDLLQGLLSQPTRKDQVFLLLFEPAMAELLYMLLINPKHGPELKEKVLKVIATLLKTDSVSDKYKVQLRLAEKGMYPGLMSLIAEQTISTTMLQYMMEQVLHTDSDASANAVLSILHLLSQADVEIKLQASRKLLSALMSSTSAPRHYAQQLAWQTIIVRLLIVRSRYVPTPLRGRSVSIIENNTSSASLFPQPTTTVQIITPAADDDNLLPDNAEVLHDTARKRPGLTLDLGNSGTTTPSVATPLTPSVPLFTQQSIDDNDNIEDDVGKSVNNNTETQNASNLENANAANSLAAPNPGNFKISVSGSNLAAMDDASDSAGNSEDLKQKLQSLGIDLNRDETMEKSEELCQNVVIILFTILWKGVEGWDDKSWKLRGQVFAAIEDSSKGYELIKYKVEMDRKLLELMLQGAIMDLKETGQTNPGYMKNAMRLIKHVYNFLCLEDDRNSLRFNERIIEDVMTLLDLLTVWESENDMIEMEQFGLFILLAYAAQEDIELCSIAAARLHTILQTRPVDKLQESCFVMAHIDGILRKAIHGNEEQYNFLIPVMKALVDKCYGMLSMAHLLPHLPSSHLSPTFFDDFKDFCHGEEWMSFMHKMVMPSKKQYESNIFDTVRVQMRSFMGDCHEDMMVDLHRRGRENGDSKLKFQEQIGGTYRHKVKEEQKRHQKFVTHIKYQHVVAIRQWQSTRNFLTGDRGVWQSDGQSSECIHWKLSSLENLSRMRPKLVYNHNFDDHSQASQMRDNEAYVASPSTSNLPIIPVAKEAIKENIGDDRLGDDEWNIISAASSKEDENTPGAGKEKLVQMEDCELVTVLEVIQGRLEVTTTHVYFFDRRTNRDEAGSEDFKWALSQLREIHFRRYNLRRSALEMFLIDQTNYFLNFKQKTRNKVYSRILSLRPPNLIYYGSRSPAELLKASMLTQKWIHREISNFDYLMQLNTIAGRTFNDLSQYPVFPWIITNYTSETLDLEDETIYRDLSKPMGIVNPKNEEEVREKYDHFEDPEGVVAKFHYGTHYSNAANVMHYLIRMEPYTSLHIQLQSGRFDVADRQFHSIPASWHSLYSNPNDVKELIPEFYYLPEFLENMNRFDLGRLQQSGEPVDHVELPKWASSPEDFITKHRKALESEYVSQNLHKWVDLIFGYKQKGPAAEEALNVFYYCTYEGAVDLDAITDPMERKAIEGMINNFGQTPCQLLKEPHPPRLSFDEAVARAEKTDRPLSIFMFLNRLKAFYVEASSEAHPLVYVCVPRNQARSFIQVGMPDTMIAISETGVLGLHGWLPYDKTISNYFTFDKDTSFTTKSAKGKKKLAGPFAPGLEVCPKLFAVTHDAKVIFSGGLWDNSIRVYSATKGKTIQNIVRHTDVVTCVSLDHSGGYLITGSRDTTCMVWQVQQQGAVAVGLQTKPLQILYGHSKTINCVAISVELDLAVSGSEDGTVILHTVRKGSYIKTLLPPTEVGWSLTVDQLIISDVGQICCYCKQHTGGKVTKEDLHLYSINGKHLCMETVQVPLSHMIIADRHLILANLQGLITIKELFGLRTLATLPLHVPITCLSITTGQSHILAGLKDGKLIIVGIKKNSHLL